MRNRILALATCVGVLTALAACGGGDDDDDGSGVSEPQIQGVVATPAESLAQGHVKRDTDVAYPAVPPVGGAHDQIWADCNGVVYDRPIRTENLVHSMEHGAVWIAYDPAKLDATGVTTLSALVTGEIYLVMSPVPDMTSPISVQSWGRQLQVDQADDPRIAQFIATYRANEDLTPEPGATCDVPSRYKELFDRDDPPPFKAVPGPDVVPPDYEQ